MAKIHAMPVVFSASITVLNTPIGTYSAQPGIRNTDSVGALIDKIVIQNGPGLRVELKWRNEIITGGPVLVDAVSWPMSRIAESAVTSGNGFISVISLSKPFYLPPGDFISVSVMNDLAGGRGLGVTVSAIGQQCAAPPTERWIPYLADYIGPAYKVNAAAISDQSTPADLGNPFSTDLFIERLIGRVMTDDGSGTGYLDREPTGVWMNFSLRLSDHLDNFWVPYPTPLPVVCNGTDRSWIINHTMEPKGFLRAEFEGTVSLSTLTGLIATLGLVGYRRIG